MQHPILSEVPNPVFPSIRDIKLYTLSYFMDVPIIANTDLCTYHPFLHAFKRCNVYIPIKAAHH